MSNYQNSSNQILTIRFINIIVSRRAAIVFSRGSYQTVGMTFCDVLIDDIFDVIFNDNLRSIIIVRLAFGDHVEHPHTTATLQIFAVASIQSHSCTEGVVTRRVEVKPCKVQPRDWGGSTSSEDRLTPK
jgi:hypothetical protein